MLVAFMKYEVYMAHLRKGTLRPHYYYYFLASRCSDLIKVHVCVCSM